MQLFSSWTGSDFLIFYSALLALASAVAWWIPAHLRDAGRRGESQDLESVALLAGGRERFAESLLADLYVRGGIELRAQGYLAVAQRQLPASPAAGQSHMAHASKPLRSPFPRWQRFSRILSSAGQDSTSPDRMSLPGSECLGMSKPQGIFIQSTRTASRTTRGDFTWRRRQAGPGSPHQDAWQRARATARDRSAACRPGQA